MNNFILIGAFILLVVLVIFFLKDNPNILKVKDKKQVSGKEKSSEIDNGISGSDIITEPEEHPIDKFISNDIQDKKIFNLDLSDDLNKEERELRRILFGLISKAKTEHPETKQMVIPFESIIFLTKGLNPLVSEDGKITVVCRKSEIEKNSEELDIANQSPIKTESLAKETVNNYEGALILGEEEIKKYMEEAVKIHVENKQNQVTDSSSNEETEDLKKQIELLQAQLKNKSENNKDVSPEVKTPKKTPETNNSENNQKRVKKEPIVETKIDEFKEQKSEIEHLINEFELNNNKEIREEKEKVFNSNKKGSYDNFLGKLKNIKKENDLSKRSMEMEFERVSLFLDSSDTVYDKKDSLLKLDMLNQNKIMKEIIDYLIKIKEPEEKEENSVDSLMDDIDIDDIDMDSLFDNELELK